MYWAVGLGGLGAIFGSFIATVAVRWPAPAVTGRSRCDGCGRTLRAFELVPILSWIVLRGRCRTCDARIGALHPAIELLGAGVGVAAGLAAPGVDAVWGAAFGWLLLLIGAVDVVAFRIPNPFSLSLAMLGLCLGVAGIELALRERLIGGVAGFAVLWAVAAGYRHLRGRMGLGGGDAKLFGAIGLWLGWRALPAVLLIACVIGLGWALARRMRADERLPLGTLLAVGAFTMWIAGHLR
ncbi:MAG: prepilin peptidase [Sphingomonadales bacterium]|nr:prepilin peptidase [Sphingomonadales bacterium]